MKFEGFRARAAHSNFLFALVMVLVACTSASVFAKEKDDAKASEKKARIIVVDDGECGEAIADTAKACNSPDMTAGLSAAQQAQAATLQTQAAQSNQTTTTAGANQAAQCQNQADMSKILAALLALKGGACLYTVSSCKSTCENDLDQLKVILAKADDGDKAMVLEKIKKKQKQLSRCSDSAPNAGIAMAQAALMVGSMFMNQQCASANIAAGATPFVANDCSVPEIAKTSLLCICQADPKNRMCSPMQPLPSGTTTSNGDFGPSTPTASSELNANDGSQVLGAAGKPNSASGSSVGGAGGGGGGPAASGGSPLAAGPSGGDGGGRSDIDKSVITGQSGSASGRTGGLAASGGGGGGGSSGSGGRAPNNAPAFDLSKFLPKGANSLRSGRHQSGQDGITSSMGPSIWEKVSVQYQTQKSYMIQDK